MAVSKGHLQRNLRIIPWLKFKAHTSQESNIPFPLLKVAFLNFTYNKRFIASRQCPAKSYLPTMAATMGFNTSILSKRTVYATTISKLDHLQRAEIKIIPRQTYMKKTMRRKPLKLFSVPPSSSVFDTNSLSPAQTIMQFYSAINEKNLKQLDKLIAEDSVYDDYSFPTPFQGKKEVMHFLKQLTMSMGDNQNMQFNVEHILEGNDYTASVNWHLEWKMIQVPFTRGCSNFSLSVNENTVVIKRAQVLIESPIKLGTVALTIFKTVSWLFDAFPAATEWFLKSPHVMFQLLMKTYNIVIQPIIRPFIAWYIRLLKFAACILSFTLNTLHYVAKILHM